MKEGTLVGTGGALPPRSHAVRPTSRNEAPTSGQPLRIALVAPPWYPVPPSGYGGIERVIHLLAQGLAHLGHRVVILGQPSPDRSLTVVPLVKDDWAGDLGGIHEGARLDTYLHRVLRHLAAEHYDVVHDHNGTHGLTVQVATGRRPVISTMHGAMPPAELELLKEIGTEAGLVAISQAQARQARVVRWLAVVHNAVPVDELEIGEQKDDYVIQLARISPDKGQHVAIEVAMEIGLHLVLAGKVGEDAEAREYFETMIRPRLGHRVSWLEDVSGRHKAELLARARAMLFPIQWEEPFGVAVVEAMASGTPVLATPRGAMPELIEPGVNGFMGQTAEELVARFHDLKEIDPRACAEATRHRFSADQMAARYERAYMTALGRVEGGVAQDAARRA